MKPLTREALLETIQKAIEEQKLTMKEIERDAEVSTDSLRDFMRGKTHMLRADKCARILKVIGGYNEYFRD